MISMISDRAASNRMTSSRVTSGRPGSGARRRLPPVLALLALLAAAAFTAWPAAVQAAPQADAPTVEMPDPASLTFRLHVSTEVDLVSAALNYKVLNPDGNVGGTLRAEVSAGRSADLSAQLLTNSNERYIPAGARISYAWTVVDQNGGTLTTPEQTVVFLDGRYQWQSRTQGNVTVYWYGNSDANANLALEASAASIRDNEALLDVRMPYPVRVVVWRGTADAKAAQQPRGSTFDAQIITGGARVGPDLLHIYDPLGAFVDVTRHESAHLVTKVAGDGPFTTIPSWLDEGTAVYAQGSPGGGYSGALQQAIRADQTLRLRNMAGSTNQPQLVDLFYGQSWSTVKFMVDRYGRQQFAAVFKTVKSGAPIDEALQQVLGVDQDGLYNAWRSSVGLQPIDFPPVPKATAAAAQATQPPLRIPTSVTAADSDGAGGAGGAGGAEAGAPAASTSGGGSSLTAIIVGAVAVLLAGGLGLLGLRLARRR